MHPVEMNLRDCLIRALDSGFQVRYRLRGLGGAAFLFSEAPNTGPVANWYKQDRWRVVVGATRNVMKASPASVAMPSFAEFKLADFDNPPVVETVLSLQFEKLTALQSVHLGLFWSKLKDQYPRVEQRPPLPSAIEQFQLPAMSRPRIQFEAVETPATPRLLLMNSEETEIVQVQDDRFITNWRKGSSQNPYPHYEPVIKPNFEQRLREFQTFVAEQRLGTIKIVQSEVTYVNHIVSGEGWQDFGQLHRIFTFWNQVEGSIPGQPEDSALHIRFRIEDEEKKPVGRLHVDVQPGVRASDNQPMYIMNLTARGQYGTGVDFFDIGRKWIVKSFEQLTTEYMHQIWGKRQD